MTDLLQLYTRTIAMMGRRGLDITAYDGLAQHTEASFLGILTTTEITTPLHIFLRERFGDALPPRVLMSHVFGAERPHEQQWLIFFAPRGTGRTNNVPKAAAEVFLQTMMRFNLYNGMLIGEGKLDPRSVRSFNTFNQQGRFVQFFLDDDILINPFESVWNVSHRILSAEASRQFLLDNHFTAGRLPRRPITDPVYRYLGCPPGRIVEIMRRTFIPGNIAPEGLFYVYTFSPTR